MARTHTRVRRHQRRWCLRRWLWSILVVFSVSGVGWWLTWDQHSHGGQRQSHAVEGYPAPAFTLPSSTGGSVDLAAYLGRQPVVLIFYMGDF